MPNKECPQQTIKPIKCFQKAWLNANYPAGVSKIQVYYVEYFLEQVNQLSYGRLYQAANSLCGFPGLCVAMVKGGLTDNICLENFQNNTTCVFQGAVFVSSGCHDKMPQTEWRE